MNPTIVDQEILRDHAGDGMNGRELEEAIRECRPDVMALYTSGYTDNAIVHEGHLDPGMALRTLSTITATTAAGYAA